MNGPGKCLFDPYNFGIYVLKWNPNQCNTKFSSFRVTNFVIPDKERVRRLSIIQPTSRGGRKSKTPVVIDEQTSDYSKMKREKRYLFFLWESEKEGFGTSVKIDKVVVNQRSIIRDWFRSLKEGG